MYFSIVQLLSGKGNWSLSQLPLGLRSGQVGSSLQATYKDRQQSVLTDKCVTHVNDETVINIQILNRSCCIGPRYDIRY